MNNITEMYTYVSKALVKQSTNCIDFDKLLENSNLTGEN